MSLNKKDKTTYLLKTLNNYDSKRFSITLNANISEDFTIKFQRLQDKIKKNWKKVYINSRFLVA